MPPVTEYSAGFTEGYKAGFEKGFDAAIAQQSERCKTNEARSSRWYTFLGYSMVATVIAVFMRATDPYRTQSR